jgi:hypothetical protein
MSHLVSGHNDDRMVDNNVERHGAPCCGSHFTVSYRWVILIVVCPRRLPRDWYFGPLHRVSSRRVLGLPLSLIDEGVVVEVRSSWPDRSVEAYGHRSSVAGRVNDSCTASCVDVVAIGTAVMSSTLVPIDLPCLLQTHSCR